MVGETGDLRSEWTGCKFDEWSLFASCFFLSFFFISLFFYFLLTRFSLLMPLSHLSPTSLSLFFFPLVCSRFICYFLFLSFQFRPHELKQNFTFLRAIEIMAVHKAAISFFSFSQITNDAARFTEKVGTDQGRDAE